MFLTDLEESLGTVESTQVRLNWRHVTRFEESLDALLDVIIVGFNDNRCLVVY